MSTTFTHTPIRWFTFYTEGTAIAAKFLEPPLFVGYVVSYVNRLQRWVKEWIIAINPSMNTRDNIRPCRTWLYPVPPLTRLIWLPHIDHLKKIAAQKMVILGPLMNRKRYPKIMSGVMLYIKTLICIMKEFAYPASGSTRRIHFQSYNC